MNIALPILSSYFTIRNADHQFTLGGAEQFLNPDPSRWALVFS